MKWLHPLCAVVLVGAVGCSGDFGSDGGPVGSGISASVSGNVVTAEGTAEMGSGAALPELPPIYVTIAGAPEIGTTVDAVDGTFQVNGAFAGRITLEFAIGAPDAPPAAFGLDVPEGAAVVLQDVRIIAGLVQSRNIQQTAVYGRVSPDGVDCAARVIEIVDDSPAHHPFVVHVIEGTSAEDSDATKIVGAANEPLACADVHADDPIAIEAGLLRPGEPAIDAIRIVVGSRRPSQPAPIPVRRAGRVTRIDCESSLLQVQSQAPGFGDLFAVRLVEETAIQCGASEPHACACADIAFGNDVEVEGVLPPRNGPADDRGVIRATRVRVFGPSNGFGVHVMGAVAAIDCSAGWGTIDVDDPRIDGQRPLVQLSSQTAITCRGGGAPRSCACEDIHVGDHVTIDADVPSAEPVVFEAVAVEVFPGRGRRGP